MEWVNIFGKAIIESLYMTIVSSLISFGIGMVV